MQNFITNLTSGFVNREVTTADMLAVLLVVAVISAYQFVIYRFVSKRSFYSKSFNIAMSIIPFFVATIIMTLQTNMVITLGTIGALAILRFRTAVKDPMDMIYLFWSVHTGIVCGAGLYKLAVITSIIVTLFILAAEVIPLGKSPFLLIVNAKRGVDEDKIIAAATQFSSYRKVKSRVISADGLDLVIELGTKKEAELVKAVSDIDEVNSVSLIAHDGQDVV